MLVFRIISILQLLGNLVKLSLASGIVSLKLISYENPSSKLSNGVCCDSRCASCDNYFKLCLSDDTTANDCSIGSLWTDEEGGDSFTFGSTITQSMPSYATLGNPLRYSITSWDGSMNLKIDIYDSDSGVNIYNHQTNEFVDTFSLNISIPATSHVSFAHPQNITLQAKPRGLEPGPKLTAQISVSCNTNYLIPSCLEYCVNTDATSRHYKCNYTTGVKRCMADWYGASCDLACLPRNDSLGHYNCLENGTKQCLPGWIDPEKNCTQASRGNMHSSSTSTPNIFSTTHIKTSISSNSIQATDSSIYKQIPLLFSTNADTTYPLSTAARMVTSSRRDDSPVSSMLPISSKMGGITGGLTSSTIVVTSSVVQAPLSTPNIKQSDPKISQTSTEIVTSIGNENSVIETFSSQLSPVGPTTELSKPPASNPPASNPPAIRTTASFTIVDDVSSQISTMHAFTVRSSSAMSRELLTASLVPTTTTQSNVNSTIVKGDQFKELPWLVLLIIPVLFTVIAIVHLHQLKKRRRSSRISPETAQRNSSKQMRRIKVKPVAAITKATKTTTL